MTETKRNSIILTPGLTMTLSDGTTIKVNKNGSVQVAANSDYTVTRNPDPVLTAQLEIGDKTEGGYYYLGKNAAGNKRFAKPSKVFHSSYHSIHLAKDHAREAGGFLGSDEDLNLLCAAIKTTPHLAEAFNASSNNTYCCWAWGAAERNNNGGEFRICHLPDAKMEFVSSTRPLYKNGSGHQGIEHSEQRRYLFPIFSA